MSLDDVHLIEAAGKEALGGGVSVGITATLNNAQVMFTAQTTPLDDGSGRTCDANDADGVQLYVDDADFVTDGIVSGDTVYNITTGAIATITEVIDLHTLKHFVLSGGSSAQWTSGDNYKVYDMRLCTITGGNLVAVDTNGDPIEPALPSVGNYLKTTSSSSATLQEIAAIQYSSYGGGVSVDITSSFAGTEFPCGTPQAPVNNIVDALSIASARGFTTLYIIGDITIDDAGDYTGMVFVGESMTKSTITIDPVANILGAEFYDAYVVGTLDGNALLNRCKIGTLNYVYGVVENCVLDVGIITLGGSNPANFLDCWSGVPGVGTPVIDMGGSGQSLGLRNYNGGIKLINKSGAESVSIDLNSGQVVLDSTVTDGTIVIRGIGKLTDNSVGATVDATHLLTPANIADGVLDEIVEGSVSLREVQRVIMAALAGLSSGGGTSVIDFRDLSDSKNRIRATVDANGNRTGVVLDVT
jgi:hypothetical protein